MDFFSRTLDQLDREDFLDSSPSAPILNPRLTVLSFGGGQDSTMIFWKLVKDTAFRKTYAPHDLIIVMSDTGDEHDETYAHVENIRAAAAAAGIPFHFLPAGDEYHLPSWPSYIGHHKRLGTVTGTGFGTTCTPNLKITPIYKFVDQYIGKTYGFSSGHGHKAMLAFERKFGKIRVLLGFAAGEEGRKKKSLVIQSRYPKWKGTIEKSFPLIDLGLDRAGCQREIESLGEEVPVPSNCIRCPFVDERELLLIGRMYPQKLEEWKEMEAVKLRKNAHLNAIGNLKTKKVENRNYGVFGANSTIGKRFAIAEGKFGHMTTAELEKHRFSHGHCIAQAY